MKRTKKTNNSAEKGTLLEQDNVTQDEEKPQDKEPETTSLPPIKRGGRSREIEQENKQPKLREQIFTEKPSIICWEEQRRWIIGVKIPEDFEVAKVEQNGNPLEKESDDEFRYRLAKLDKINILNKNGKESSCLLVSRQDYLVFKMMKNWKGPGRLVPYITVGYYLIIAPEGWKRDEIKSGSASISPAEVLVAGYRAHYFFQEKETNQPISFIMEGEDLVYIKQEGHSYQLDGNEISDASEEMGRLFGEGDIYLTIANEEKWNDTGVIIIGEEGFGRGKWRTQFFPQVGITRQKLPQALMERGGGWYFLRIYDNQNNLLESFDFRFMSALRRIDASNYSNLPDRGGHKPVHLTFYHALGCEVDLDGSQDNPPVPTKETEKTKVVIPKYSQWDQTIWKVRINKTELLVQILIERIRWSLMERDLIKGDQSDKVLRGERDWFNAESQKIICIWLPKPGWARYILVGFNESNRKQIIVKSDEQPVKIMLSDFCDASEIEDKTKEVELKLWLKSGEVASICRIRSESKYGYNDIIYKQPEIKDEIPEPSLSPEETSFQQKSCVTCVHARTQRLSYWCRHKVWTPSIVDWIFYKNYSQFHCWRYEGEDEDNGD